MAKEIFVAFGVDVDAVGGLLGSTVWVLRHLSRSVCRGGHVPDAELPQG